jgi:hypothetical protein
VSDAPRTVRLVLDATAIAAFTRGSDAVGEILGEINAEHGAVIVPLSCLVEAGHATAMLERDYLQMLIAHEATFLVSDDPKDWVELTELRVFTERADRASAALIALEYEVDVMTRDPRWYSSVADGQRVLRFED